MGTNAVIYARISDARDGDSAGVDRQLAECVAYADQHDYTVVGQYIDNNRSAMTGARPQYLRMLDELDGVDAVIVWSVDRLYRRLRDLETLVERLGSTQVIALRSGDINLSSADGRSVARILGSLAQRESEKMGERIQIAAEQRARAGKFLGGPRRLGYTADATGLVDDEVDAIQWAYRHVDNGGSIGSVIREWNRRGIAGPLGGTIHGQQIRTCLMRPMNAGYSTYKGELIPTSESPAIIDVETWHRVRTRLLDPSRRTNGGRLETTLLSGIARCGECGGPIRAHTRHWEGRAPQGAYRCHEKFCTSRKRDTLDDYVTAVVLGVLEKNKDALLESIRAANTQPERLDQVEGLKRELAALGEMVAREQLSATAYAAAVGPVEQRIAALESVPTSAPGAAVAAMLASGDIAAAWEQSTVQVRRQVLNTIIEKIVVNKVAAGAKFDPATIEIIWKDGDS